MTQHPLHATPINEKAPVTAHKSIAIHASAETVWALLTDITQWPNWYADIQQTKLKSPLVKGARFDWKSGGVTIHSTLHTVIPMRALGWTGTSVGLGAIHNWTLETGDDGVTVYVEESLQGVLAVLFRRTFQKNLEQGMQAWLEALRTAAEK